MACKITNMFWKETCIAYATFTSTIEIDDAEIGQCGVWYSNQTKFKEVANAQWKNKGVCILDDLLDHTGKILSYEEFKDKFQVKATYLDFLGLVRSLPGNWLMQAQKKKQQRPVIHPYVAFILRKRRGAKIFLRARPKAERVFAEYENFLKLSDRPTDRPTVTLFSVLYLLNQATD